jgi:hypothetical protein
VKLARGGGLVGQPADEVDTALPVTERLPDLGQCGVEALAVGDDDDIDARDSPLAPAQCHRERRDALPQAHYLAQVAPGDQDNRRSLGEQVIGGAVHAKAPAVREHVSARQLG